MRKIVWYYKGKKDEEFPWRLLGEMLGAVLIVLIILIFFFFMK